MIDIWQPPSASGGTPPHSVHVAVQIGEEPVGLVRGDANSARWAIDVRAVGVDGGGGLALQRATTACSSHRSH